MLIPIGTDIRTRHAPTANWVLIGLNVLIFLITDVLGGQTGQVIKSEFMLDPARPLLFQYVTYQFLHGDLMHLAGNMLFLWIFGGGVCDRMGGLAYGLFYLAGGVIAGVVFTIGEENPIIGASGAIAAVTTAFMVLFPRVHVTMLLFFILITTIQVPAMILIVFKIILWDNVIAPSFDRGVTSNVAYSAHLGGYAFGFIAALLMLLLRALPRNQFDLLGLWDRQRRRAVGGAAAGYGRTRLARPVRVEEMDSRPLAEVQLTPVERLRAEILDLLAQRAFAAAAEKYRRLLTLDPEQVLPRQQQLEIANTLAESQRHEEAVAAYEAFLSAYPSAADIFQVRLLMGLIYHRYLDDPKNAAEHLRAALGGLTLKSQRDLATEELRQVETRFPGGANPASS